MQSLPLKLDPGSDLRLSLEELGRQHGINGFVLGVVGNLTRAAFQCPGQAEPLCEEMAPPHSSPPPNEKAPLF